MKNIIEVRKLSKYFQIRTNKNVFTGFFNPAYKEVKAVNDISLTITKGEAVAFLGPNGAGKTTTTKMLTGLMYPTKGSVKVLGYIPFDKKREFLQRIGLVMGNKAGLNWDLTANQSFWLNKNIYKINDKIFDQRVILMSQLMDVDTLLDTQVRRLSLGERMKLELIGALLHNPEVLFLDEPTIGLDIIAKKNIRRFLKDIQNEFKTTIILTSHDMDDIEQVCQRVIIINKGEKVYDDSLTALTSQYEKTRYVRFIFDTQPQENKIAALKTGKIVEKTNDYYLFEVESSKLIELITKVASQFKLIDLQVESVPLEEIIEHVFSAQ
ncbi:MAG: ATP-binding cassette domain-containing protein [bacterium]|nr:ATP-binding cassette domain-containing protein [bacterium]